jgi:hypothetical protein
MLPPAVPPAMLPPAVPPAMLPPAVPPAMLPPAVPPAVLPPAVPPAVLPPAVPPAELPPAATPPEVPPAVRPPAATPPALPPPTPESDGSTLAGPHATMRDESKRLNEARGMATIRVMVSSGSGLQNIDGRVPRAHARGSESGGLEIMVHERSTESAAAPTVLIARLRQRLCQADAGTLDPSRCLDPPEPSAGRRRALDTQGRSPGCHLGVPCTA